MNAVLCGMPASGKTTVAEALSKMSGMPVVDTDALIVEEHGEINKIFDTFGEARFREMETEAVKRAAGLKNAVIATGGGCVIKQENVCLLKESGKIFYLRAKPQTLVNRLTGDDTRPLLRGKAEERINALFSARASLYEGAADYVIDVDGLTPGQIAKKITELL